MMKKRSTVLGVVAVCAGMVAVSLHAGTNTWLGKSPAWEAAENWSAGVAPTGDVDVVIRGGLAHDPVLAKPVAMTAVLRIEKGATVLAEGALKIAPGKLQMAEGGRLCLGVVRHGERVVDTALEIVGPLPAGVMPDIPVPTIPPAVPSTVTRMTNGIGPAVPDSARLVNVAPFAEIRTVPYMTMARTLVDPDPEQRTVAVPEVGTPAKGVRYEFRFPKPQTVAAVQWAVVAGPWAILADTTGNGQYDQLLRMDLEGRLSNPGGVWRSRAVVVNRFWPAVKAYGIRIVSLLGTLTDNRLYDVQILCPARAVTFKAPPPPSKRVAEIRTNEGVDVPAPPKDGQYLKGFHAEPWMFGLPQWITMSNRPALSAYGPFTNFVRSVKALHGNYVNLWPPKAWENRGPGTYEMDMLWPSQYDRHSLNENVLKPVCEAFQKEGITLFVMDRCPYPKKLEEFPAASAAKGPAPYVSRQAREYLSGIAVEEVLSGADGVGIGLDEQYYTPIRYPGQADKTTREVFEQRFKLPFPEKPADTEAFRKWIVFAYEEFASYLADAAAAAKAANPHVMTKAPITTLDTAWNCRMDWGVAHDVVGHAALLDYFRASGYQDAANIGHYVTAANTKRVMAANRTRGAVGLHNCPWASDPVKQPGYYLDFTPVWMSGPPVSHIMHGGKLPAYWRQNFVYYGGYDKHVEQAFSILDTLAAWGGREARVPRHIAVLRSRASEDWWQIRQRYREDGDPMDQTRGYVYEKWLLEFLLSSGYPFDMYYLDHPADFAGTLSDYAVAILPFPYSMSQEAFGAVQRAADKGTKVLVFDRQGETDEWGIPHPKPLLADMIAGGQAALITDDVPTVGHHPEVLSRLQKALDTMLGSRKPIEVNTYGDDIEVSLLEKGTQERFICLINWTDRSVTADIGLRRLPDGRYEMLQRDLREVRKVALSGKEQLTPAVLEKFRVPLERWEIKLLYVRPVAAEGRPQ